MAAATDEEIDTSILAFLKNEPSPKKVNEVATHLSIAKKEANKRLYELEKRNKVTRDNSARWAVVYGDANVKDDQGTSASENADTALVPVNCTALCERRLSTVSVVATNQMTEIEQQILKVLKEHKGQISTLEIAKSVGKKTAKDVNCSLYSLKSKGLLFHHAQNKQWSMKGTEGISYSGNPTIGSKANAGGLSWKQSQSEAAPFGQKARNQAGQCEYEAPACTASSKQWPQIQATLSQRPSQNLAAPSGHQAQNPAVPPWQLLPNQAAPAVTHPQNYAGRSNQQAHCGPAAKHMNKEKQIWTQPLIPAVLLSQPIQMQTSSTGYQTQSQAPSLGQNKQKQATQLENQSVKQKVLFQQPAEHKAVAFGQEAHNKPAPSCQQAETQADAPGHQSQDQAGQAAEKHVGDSWKQKCPQAAMETHDDAGEKEEQKNGQQMRSVYNEANVNSPHFTEASPDRGKASPKVQQPPPPGPSDDGPINHQQLDQHLTLCDMRDLMERQAIALESLRQTKQAHSVLRRKKMAIYKQQVKATKDLAVAVASCAMQMQMLSQHLLQGKVTQEAVEASIDDNMQQPPLQAGQLLVQKASLGLPADNEGCGSNATDTSHFPSTTEASPPSPGCEFRLGSGAGRGQRKQEQDLCAVASKRKK
ncbi:Z-DNA-binding protein 1 isoform X1 [Ambystoma mexicanum]|uniref:Z-DNA-binding protein 1 isoform X1 n=1 Tax=Ambystoma mexicanum TaxID=8296 RepID=UPI0037E82242